MYDVIDLLMYSGENITAKDEELETTEEVTNYLKHVFAARNMLHSYTIALSTFLIYNFMFYRY